MNTNSRSWLDDNNDDGCVDFIGKDARSSRSENNWTGDTIIHSIIFFGWLWMEDSIYECR